MNIKTNIIIFILLIIISCTTNKQEEAHEIISDFYIENHIDSRETIFNVQAISKNEIVILEGETDRADLKENLLSLFTDIKIEDKIKLLPDIKAGENTSGLVNISVANLRSEPNHSAELVSQALMGTPVKILKIEDGWLLIQTPDKYISWIDPNGIFTVSASDMEAWRNTNRAIFNGDNGTVYETANFDFPVSDVCMGNILEVVEIQPKAIKLKFPDGRTGFSEPSNWIDFNDFKNNIIPDSIQIKNMAKQLMGRPYLWGGTSSRAIDCSGFVKMLYFMNGVILARDASLQYRHGEIIERVDEYVNFKTGDLLFFGRAQTDTQAEKITHVALSLGNTEYIHASGKVERNSFNPESKIYSEYRKNSFIGAKRVIGFVDSEGIQSIKKYPWY